MGEKEKEGLLSGKVENYGIYEDGRGEKDRRSVNRYVEDEREEIYESFIGGGKIESMINEIISIKDVIFTLFFDFSEQNRNKSVRRLFYFLVGFCILIGCIVLFLIDFFDWDGGINVESTSWWEQNGIVFSNDHYCPHVHYFSDESLISAGNLLDVGGNFVSIVVTQYQDSINSTDIYAGESTADNTSLVNMIMFFRNKGIKVQLSPRIVVLEDMDDGQREIGKYFSMDDWGAWFGSYCKFIISYAQIAQFCQCEQFSIGRELVIASTNEMEWRHLVFLIRGIFSGTVTYNAMWGGEETNITWWDALDLIGVNAFYPILEFKPHPTLQDLLHVWEIIIGLGLRDPSLNSHMQFGLQELSQRFNRSILFTEAGYASSRFLKMDGSHHHDDGLNIPEISTVQPPDITTQEENRSDIDLDYQNDRYHALFHAFVDDKNFQDWFTGVHWWNVLTDPNFGGPENFCFTPLGKTAEKTLRLFFGSPRPSKWESKSSQCSCIV